MTALADRVHLKNTEAFVAYNPQQLVVSVRDRVKTEAGGFIWTTTDTLEPQIGRIIHLNQRSASIERTTPDGNIILITARLIALPDFVVKRGDWVKDNAGTDWLVGTVSTSPTWRLSAELGQHG